MAESYHKKNKLKIGDGVLLNYFSLTLNKLFMLPPFWPEMTEICKSGEASSELFYLFGSSDILVLGYSDDYGKLNEMQNMKSFREIEGVMDYFSYYGVAISVYPNSFNLNKVAKHNPIIGTITIKIRTEAWGEIFAKLKTFKEVRDIFTRKFKEAIRKTNRDCNGLDSKNFKAVLLMSSGTEDGIIIFFTRSFEYIKRFTTNLRTLELSDLISLKQEQTKMKHIIVSTHTILGVKLASKGSNVSISIPENRYDKINWEMLFEVRPGHLQHAINSINKLNKIKSRKRNITQATPVAGRNDIITYSQQPYRLDRFLETYVNIVSELVDRENESILSIETRINFPRLRKKVESIKKPEYLFPIDNPIRKEINDLYNIIKESKNLQILERESFNQILRKIGFVVSDRYLQDSFSTFLPIIFRGINAYSKVPIKKKIFEQDGLDLFTNFIETCYTARYQGNPPVGETAVCPTLGNYTIGVKLLVLLDFLGNRIIRLIAEKYNDGNNFFCYYIATTNMNCVSACQLPIKPLPISFICLPPRPLFHPEILIVTFLHELGHVVFNCILDSKNLRKIKEKYKNQLSDFSEIFSEIFTAKILFNLNFNNHERSVNNVIREYQFSSEGQEIVLSLKSNLMTRARILSEDIKNSETKNFKKLCPRLPKVIISEIIIFLNFFIAWNDEILQKIRLFYNSKNKRESMFDLWIYLNDLGEKCYYKNPD